MEMERINYYHLWDSYKCCAVNAAKNIKIFESFDKTVNKIFIY